MPLPLSLYEVTYTRKKAPPSFLGAKFPSRSPLPPLPSWGSAHLQHTWGRFCPGGTGSAPWPGRRGHRWGSHRAAGSPRRRCLPRSLCETWNRAPEPVPAPRDPREGQEDRGTCVTALAPQPRGTLAAPGGGVTAGPVLAVAALPAARSVETRGTAWHGKSSLEHGWVELCSSASVSPAGRSSEPFCPRCAQASDVAAAEPRVRPPSTMCSSTAFTRYPAPPGSVCPAALRGHCCGRGVPQRSGIPSLPLLPGKGSL